MHTLPLQLRFNDVDMMGHVNNAVIMEFFDLGKSSYFADAGILLSAPTKQAKALEIDMWLQKHASKDARYVILDDEKIFIGEDYYNHMIEVNDQEGIGVYEVHRICCELNEKHKKMTSGY